MNFCAQDFKDMHVLRDTRQLPRNAVSVRDPRPVRFYAGESRLLLVFSAGDLATMVVSRNEVILTRLACCSDLF